MRMMFGVLAVLIAIVVAMLAGWRFLDHRSDRAEMDRLLALQPMDAPVFAMSMVADLPEPVRRYFSYSIAEGTPLLSVARLKMRGRFSLGAKNAPNYFDIQADQVLAAPEGFVWKMAAGSAHLGISGSDSGIWTRFWVGNILPVARFGRTDDHARSAFGRTAGEAVMWTPAAVLPGRDVSWAEVDDDTVAVTIRRGALEQVVEMKVAADGQPTQIEFARWSNANPEKTYQLQPFGGVLSDFREVQGFRIPMHVEAGNFFGTDRYFPFYVIDVDQIAFPPSL